MSDFQDVIESLGAEDDHRIKVLLNAFKMISDDLQEEREISSSLLGKYDALEAETVSLREELHRINSLANCGSVQNWLKLSDEDKAKWFYLYCQKDSENVALRRELDDLRESINGMKTQAC